LVNLVPAQPVPSRLIVENASVARNTSGRASTTRGVVQK
jgi:hypothetical protein